MGPQKIISTRAWFEIFLLSLVWGGSFLAFSLALREIGVFTTVAMRVLGGAMMLWVYIALRGLPVPKDMNTWGAFLVMGFLNNALPFSLIAWGQLHIASGLASILNASTAVFTVLIAALIFADERLTLRKSIGVTLGFLGVSTTIGLSALAELNLTSLSQLAIIGSSVSYAFAGVWARSKIRNVSPQMSAAGMTTCSTLIMIPLALYIDGIPSFAYSASTWGAMFYLSIMATAVAYLLYYRVLDMAGSSNLLLVTMTVAPIAIILGALFLGENLKPQAYVGFVLLSLGLLIIDGRLFRRRKDGLG